MVARKIKWLMLERKKKLFSLKSDPGYKPEGWWYRKCHFFIYHDKDSMQCFGFFYFWFYYLYDTSTSLLLFHFLSDDVNIGIYQYSKYSKYILNIFEVYSNIKYISNISPHHWKPSTWNFNWGPLDNIWEQICIFICKWIHVFVH